MIMNVIVATVPLRTINTKPEEFSARRAGLDTGHAQKLASLIKEGAPLPPLDVWQAGEDAGLVVLDGHHRLAAYKLAKWRDEVPVRVHRGSRVAALMVASRENARLRLSLTNAERLDWAWMLERMAEAARNKLSRSRDEEEAAELSLVRIARASGVSKRTVAAMRALARKATAQAGFAATGSWTADRAALLGEDRAEWAPEQADAYRSETIARISEDVGKVLKPHLGRKPDLVAEALGDVLGRRRDEVARLWLQDMDEFREAIAELDERGF